MSEPYSNTTQFSMFQTLGYGDRIWPENETTNWQKVEQKFLAINYTNFLKQSGTWSQTYIDPSLSTVSLKASGLVPAFEGSINGSYFNITDNLVWSLDTTNSHTYYLYLTEVTGQTDPTSPLSLDKEVTTVLYTEPADLQQRLLVAIVEVTGGVGISSMNTDPEGTEIVSDVIYDTTITVGTDAELDLRTILGLPAALPEVKFVTVCVSSATIAPYFISIEYNIDGNAYAFTIHSCGIDPYDLPFDLDLKLLIKYSL